MTYFPLGRGTRQWRSLPPLLFAISIEPLAIALWLYKDLKGIRPESLEFKFSLYADDALLYVSDLTSSLPVLPNILRQFQTNFKSLSQKWEQFLVLKRSQKCLKYLGIEVTHTLPMTFRKNFITLLDKCKQDMVRWGSLPLSLGVLTLSRRYYIHFYIYFKTFPFWSRSRFFFKKRFMESLSPSYGETNIAVLASSYFRNQNI